MKESWLDVQLCQDGTEGCGVTNSTGPLGVLKFPKRSSEEKVLQISPGFKMILFQLLRNNIKFFTKYVGLYNFDSPRLYPDYQSW